VFFIGIDPGHKGAIALLDPATNHLQICDMPLLPKPKGTKGVETDYATLGDALCFPPGFQVQAILEHVWSMPREGVSSAHAFGRNVGAIRMALALNKIPYHLVTAVKWKKHFGLSSDKDRSRGLASQRFPANASNFTRIKDDGRAEASLLALYGAELHSSSTHATARKISS